MTEDISSDVIKQTQKLLGKYVKKPVLTEKLLKKPPFRFLHDIVISVIKETGFLKGLFTSDELISDNVKEKDSKIAFLNKLIDAVKIVTKTDLTVRASKIVAGLEPTKTNLLLQAIGKAIHDKIDTSGYVANLNSESVEAATEKKKLKKSTLKDDKGKSSKLQEDSRIKTNKSKKISESPRNKTKTNTPKDSSRKEKKADKTNKTDSKRNIQAIEEKVTQDRKDKLVIPKEKETIVNKEIFSAVDDQSLDNQTQITDKQTIEAESFINNIDIIKVDEGKSDNTDKNCEAKEVKHSEQNLQRPKSAHHKREESTTLKHENENNFQNETTLELTVSKSRPKSSLRPPSVRPSSARPGAPRLRPDSALPLQETNVTMGGINVIVENVDIMDDEETVVIQSTSELSEQNLNFNEVPDENKGQLVEQILEQIHDGEGPTKKIDIDWERDALHNKEGAAKEINQLRSLIQMLTKTANPLGKLMNYLHEDIDAMHGELQMWTNSKKQLLNEIYKQRRLTAESNKPLLTHLEHLQDEIKKQQQEIVMVRSNIIKNESRIKELLNV